MSANPPSPRGEIITFYSYKGGTGRTMALANVGCVLAERLGPDERLLVVDWDLEAPGLHRFFPGRLGQSGAGADLGLGASPGLIDFFTALYGKLPDGPAASEDAADAIVERAVSELTLDPFIGESGIPRVQIVRAGRNDDGQYSRRVNTFNWEGLFFRAPTVYRTFAEHLARRFRYVLVDSRTGITDISGICTSLLPEKLVVVFTPNRQSLTGLRDLIGRATAYRRSSDDLRPLLIYPLPSRIEASLQDLRAHWRLGNRDLDLIGYQPMFEALLAEAYGLEKCDLNEYFDVVQIQQTPDYAYGEEIAVLRTTDRFSLGNSYRVFVDRLVSGQPPWIQTVPEAPAATSSIPTPAADSKTGTVPVLAPIDGPSGRYNIFFSYAPADRLRVQPIASACEAQGWDVVFDVPLAAGAPFQQAVANALDEADAIVVCWSKSSAVSRSVLDEASEGLRRGVLVPVLLDDVVPPLGFRNIQSADFSREDPRALKALIEAVRIVARGRPGSASFPPSAVPAESTKQAPGARPLSRFRGLLAAAAVLIIAIGIGWFGLRTSRPAENPPTPDPGGSDSGPATSTAPPPVPGTTGAGATSGNPLNTVPDFVGAQTVDVKKTAALLQLDLVMRDERGNESEYFEGVVTEQKPAAGTRVAPRTRIQLRVSTVTVVVPTVVRNTLGGALQILENANLRLGNTESRYVRDVRPGLIISQKPEGGVRVAAGTAVDVVVAATLRAPSTREVRQPARVRPPG